MTRKQSAAEFLAQQSAERGDDAGDLIEKARSRIRREGSEWFLVAAPAEPGRKEKTLNITFMWEHLEPQSAEMFAVGLSLATLHITPKSTRAKFSTLRNGLFSYFADLNRLTSPDGRVVNLRKVPKLQDIDEHVMQLFKVHLDTYHSGRKQGYRKVMIEVAQLVIECLRYQPDLIEATSPRYRPLSNLYPQHKDETKHTELIGDLDFDDIVNAALNECEAIMARDEIRQAQMLELQGDLARRRNDRTALSFAVHLQREYARRSLATGSIRKKSLSIASTILGMKVDDWETRSLLGVDRLRLFPTKPRAGRRQRFEITITDDADHPLRLLEYVRRRTQPLRDMNPDYCRRNLFVRWSRNPREVRIFDSSQQFPGNALSQFIRDNELVAFTLRQLRPTAMDRVHEVTGDLMRTQAFANHASSTTTERHYPSSARMRREQEKLGRAMELRHRDIATNWNVTSFELPPDLDKVAATPGFGCRDPHLGWIETEVPGRLCEAYGHCAGCQLAKVDYGSARACAYLHQLRERIDEAQQIIGAEAWLTRWAPVKAELLLRLDRFSPTAKTGAVSVIITKIPPVE
jgi:hypothetical protein